MSSSTQLINTSGDNLLLLQDSGGGFFFLFFSAFSVLTSRQGRSKQKHKLSRNLGQEWHAGAFSPACSDWLDPCRLLQDFGRAEEGGDRTVPTGPLIDGMIASSWSPLLRPHTGNQHQMATTPPSSLTSRLIYGPRRTSYYFLKSVPKKSDSIVSDHFTFFQCKSTRSVLFFSSFKVLNNCLIKGCSWKCLSIPPEHLKALASWRPLIPIMASFSSRLMRQPCSAPQLSHSSPGEIIFSSRHWFVTVAPAW